jgi:hypothetical protein
VHPVDDPVRLIVVQMVVEQGNQIMFLLLQVDGEQELKPDRGVPDSGMMEGPASGRTCERRCGRGGTDD